MKFKDVSITFHTTKAKEYVDFYTKCFQPELAFDSGCYVVILLKNETDTQSRCFSFQDDNDYYDRVHFSRGISPDLKTTNVDVCYDQFKKTGISFIEDITNHKRVDRAFSTKPL